MKAKVKATGEIINIVSCNTEFVSNYPYKGKSDTYPIENLEFLRESAPEKTTLEGWVARDKVWDKDNYSSDLYLCPRKPKRDKSLEEWVNCGDFMLLPHDSFPSITWESEPRKARIEITLDEKGE